MKKQDICENYGSEGYPPDGIDMIDDEDDDWDDSTPSEHEKATYIKHIRQDLAAYRTYCPAEAMAQAIGGDFTASFVLSICAESEWPIPNHLRNGKPYVAISPFLEKLQAGLTFEDAPNQHG